MSSLACTQRLWCLRQAMKASNAQAASTSINPTPESNQNGAVYRMLACLAGNNQVHDMVTTWWADPVLYPSSALGACAAATFRVSAASGAPPTLSSGADDIFWVAHLHAALEEHGYHPGDEEVEAWVFGEQTLSALLTFQAGGMIQLQNLSCAASSALQPLCGLELRRHRGWRRLECVTLMPGGVCSAQKT